MSHSVSPAIIITGATENKIERNLCFIMISLRFRRFCRKLYTYQKHWVKSPCIKGLSVYSFGNLTSSNICSTLSKICCVYRRSYSVLREGRSRLFIRRTVSAYFFVTRSVSLMTRSITIPRSDLCNTRTVIYRNLEYRYQLQPNTGNTTFIKKSG